jgi:tripartite-type tricarboxylate transporter receptor subunit TctC
MFAPKQTARGIVARIHAETVKALQNPSVIAKLANLGVEPLTQSPEDFDIRVAKEARIAVELARAAKIPLQ